MGGSNSVTERKFMSRQVRCIFKFEKGNDLRRARRDALCIRSATDLVLYATIVQPCIICICSYFAICSATSSPHEEVRTGANLTRGLTNWPDRVLMVAERATLSLP